MAAILVGARRSRAQWQSLVERAERSPLSIAAFCATQGVSPASFYRWRQRLSSAAGPAQVLRECAPFVDLGVLEAGASQAEEGASAWDVELRLEAGVVLRLRRR